VSVRGVLTVAAKDLRQRMRDRSAYVIAFLVPFGLALVFSLTLSNVEEGTFTATYAVVNHDGGEVAGSFVRVLEDLDFVKLRMVASAAAAERLADDGDVSAAFVIPEGFSAQAATGRGGRIDVITNPDSQVGGLIARSLATSFASDLNAVQVSVAVGLGDHAANPDPAELAALVERARATAPTARLQQDTAENRLFSSTTFYAAGMAVFFVFFTVEFGVRSLLAERESGTLARLLVAPIRPGAILAGKTLATFVVGLVSMTALVVASTLLLGAEWGNPLGVALLVVSGVLAAMGLTALVSGLARTPAQAGGYASVAAVVLGLLGGTFFPVSQGPAFLAGLSLIAPQAWLMRGFQELAGGGTVAEILPAVTAVLLFAVVLGGIGALRAGRLTAR
jgi:ABC-2 type transport system permease protein